MSKNGLFESFYHRYQTRACKLSGQERIDKGLQDTSLTYGEMPIASLEAILAHLKIGPRDRLLDMGSGSGKIVLGALYLYPSLWVAGVELLNSLYQLSIEIFAQFRKQLFADNLLDGQVEFIHGNMYNIDLKNFNIIFLSLTTMDDENLEKTSNHIARCAIVGCQIVSIGRPLKGEFKRVRLKVAGAYRMGWQKLGDKTPVFIYEVKD